MVVILKRCENLSLISFLVYEYLNNFGVTLVETCHFRGEKGTSETVKNGTESFIVTYSFLVVLKVPLNSRASCIRFLINLFLLQISCITF